VREVERIKKAYARRDQRGLRQVHSPFERPALFASQQRERVLVAMLKRHGFEQLHDKHILDVGCGYGDVLRRFIDYGASPENMAGIDLLEDRVERAKRLHPNIEFQCASADNLPYGNKCFDIVMTFTVFTSILDQEMKMNVAREMLRVLKADGIILWYDYLMNNPRNPDVRGVGRKEIHRVFPGCTIYLRRVTLAPPLARWLVPRSWVVAYLLEKIPLLSTHYLGVIRKLAMEAKR